MYISTDHITKGEIRKLQSDLESLESVCKDSLDSDDHVAADVRKFHAISHLCSDQIESQCTERRHRVCSMQRVLRLQAPASLLVAYDAKPNTHLFRLSVVVLQLVGSRESQRQPTGRGGINMTWLIPSVFLRDSCKVKGLLRWPLSPHRESCRC